MIIGKDFKVTYDSVEAIHKGHIAPLPSNQAVFEEPVKGEMFREVELQVMLSMLSNAHDLPGENLAELFPDVQITSIEDFFRAGWTLKQSQISEYSSRAAGSLNGDSWYPRSHSDGSYQESQARNPLEQWFQSLIFCI